jgi:DNA mismatch repair protein MutS2
VTLRGPSTDGSGKLEVDVRGCRAEEAIMIVDQFLDEAVVSGQPFARIIHGKGTGKLREALQEHLKNHSAGYNFRLGEWGEGDFGVTVVEF